MNLSQPLITVSCADAFSQVNARGNQNVGVIFVPALIAVCVKMSRMSFKSKLDLLSLSKCLPANIGDVFRGIGRNKN